MKGLFENSWHLVYRRQVEAPVFPSSLWPKLSKIYQPKAQSHTLPKRRGIIDRSRHNGPPHGSGVVNATIQLQHIASFFRLERAGFFFTPTSAPRPN